MSERSSPHSRGGQIALWIFVAAILAFLMLPLLVIIPMSFTSVTFLIFPPPGWSLRWYEELVNNPIWATTAWNSLRVGIVATGLATVLGTLFVMGLSFGRLPFRRTLVFAMLSPMIVPVIVTGVGLFYFYASIGLTGGFTALVLGHTVLALPFVVITVLAATESFDRSLIAAAQSLGASPVRVFWRVVLPLIAPGVITGAVFAFATSLDDVVVALFLAGPGQRTLPRQIFSGVRENISPAVASVSVVLSILSIILWMAVTRLQRRAARQKLAAAGAA